MRPLVPAAFLFMGVLLPNVGTAQIAYRPEPRPLVTAAAATWQINGEPIFFAGSFYLPTGPTVFFDGNLMRRVGEYLTVPLYVNTTHEAFSMVFVPVGGGVMKPYERRRAGALAGTVGSTTPSWPVQVSGSVGQPDLGVGVLVGDPLQLPESVRPVGTSGTEFVCSCTSGTGGTVAPAAAPPAAPPPLERTLVQTVPQPTRNTGISVQFDGAQWVSAGPAVPYYSDRFVPVGDHHGFPVYRAAAGNSDTIYVTVVADGPLAPYTRR